jgi:antirestriction protein
MKIFTKLAGSFTRTRKMRTTLYGTFRTNIRDNMTMKKISPTKIVEECYDLPEFAKTYFDYKQFARDLFMCDYWFDDGFVFRAA